MNLGYTEKINKAKVPSVQANSESEAKCQTFQVNPQSDAKYQNFQVNSLSEAKSPSKQVNPKSSKLLDLNLTSINWQIDKEILYSS